MPDRVTLVFSEIQVSGLLSKEISINKTKSTSNFQAKPNFVIAYNPSMNKLGPSSIRYALFHEEGHHYQKQRTDGLITWTLIIVGGLFLPILFLLKQYFQGIEIILIGGLVAIIYTLPMIYVSLYFVRKQIWQDEYDADSWAGRQLIKFNKKPPHIIAEQAFDELDKNMTWFQKWNPLGIFYGRLLHPRDTDRVNRLMGLFPNNSLTT